MRPPGVSDDLQGHVEPVGSGDQHEAVDGGTTRVTPQVEAVGREVELVELRSAGAVDEHRSGDAPLPQVQESAPQAGPGPAGVRGEVEWHDPVAVDDQAPRCLSLGGAGSGHEFVDERRCRIHVEAAGPLGATGRITLTRCGREPHPPGALREGARRHLEKSGVHGGDRLTVPPLHRDGHTGGRIQASKVHPPVGHDVTRGARQGEEDLLVLYLDVARDRRGSTDGDAELAAPISGHDEITTGRPGPRRVEGAGGVGAADDRSAACRGGRHLGDELELPASAPSGSTSAASGTRARNPHPSYETARA